MDQRRPGDAEQYLIHTQRDDLAGAAPEAEHVRWPRVRRVSTTCRHKTGAVKSPRRRQRLSQRFSTTTKVGCGAAGGLRGTRSACHGPIEIADEPNDEEHEAEDEVDELRKENEDLRVQLQDLRDEQAIAAESHARVVALHIKKQNDLAVQLLKFSDAATSDNLDGDLFVENCTGAVVCPELGSGVHSSGYTAELPRGECQIQDEQPEVTGTIWEDIAEEGGKIAEFGSSTEGRMLRTKYAAARCETLASRAQCWEMQGALRKVQQEKQFIESKMNAILSVPDHATNPAATVTWPCASAPPTVCVTVPSHRSSGAMSPSFPPRVPVTRRTFGGATAMSPVQAQAFPTQAPLAPSGSSSRRNSPPCFPWSVDTGHTSVRDLTPSRRLAGNTTPTPFHQRFTDSSPSRHGATSPIVSQHVMKSVASRPSPLSPGGVTSPCMPPMPPMPTVPPPLPPGSQRLSIIPASVSSAWVLMPSASTPTIALATQALVPTSPCIVKSAQWTRDQAAPPRDMSPPPPAPKSQCPCCGAKA